MSDNREEFVAGLIGHWIEQGLTNEEMTKAATMLADLICEAAKKDVSFDTLVKAAHDKQAFIETLGRIFPYEWLASQAGKLFGKGTDIAAGAIQAAVNKAPEMALIGGVGALAAPAALGYYGGRYFGDLTDQGDEAIKTIKDQELLRALRESAAFAQQRKQLYNREA